MPRSDAVRGARGQPLVTAVFRPFSHDSGTMRTPHYQAVEATGLVSRVEGSR
jgi:hypothetical protein